MKFYHVAKKASKFERIMNYNAAAECWKEAARLCCLRDNIEWCVNRSMFCETLSTKSKTV
ncbi:TPA: ANR family transcriptional regulator [Escherichia coli]|nr:ANR family transcriptional regulator [Escherichia albertii]HCH7808605.1 ANR family transcriptional regulator [Escherichia coli]HCI3155542.1 ANR family transcriptional regulator [Escherichia coli]HCI7221617.1 ANR family transcriptional regulator [Escherichia coli]HCT6531072.1 ANR family transcriptional regulator [Escherichia coli]